LIRVLLADDQALIRAGFRALLDAQEGIEVVGEAADGEEAIRLTRAREPRPSPELGQLSEREREVMGLVAAGLSNDEIADKLVVSPATAKTHVSRAMVKLGARDRAQLVVFAYESGPVRSGWLS
jgi:DNA-binding NarL/FixJ family response regulator